MARRQRKNPGDPQQQQQQPQQLQLNKGAPKGMLQREKETILKDKNFLSSISDLCKNENNLNLLSSKITSILNCNLKEMNKKLMNNVATSDSVGGGVVGGGVVDDMDEEDEDNNNADNGFHSNNDFSAENLNASDMEAKMMAAAGKNMRSLLQQKRNEEAAMMNESISGNDTNDMEHDEDDDESERNSFNAALNRRSLLENSQLAITSNPRFKDFLLQTNPNLVISSKGSKKWISDTMEMDENDVMTQANRDFLAKLISSKLHKNANRGIALNDVNEHSPILDVDSNMHHHAHHSHQNQQQQSHDQFNQAFHNQANGVNQQQQASQQNNGNDGGMMEMQQAQYTNNANNTNNNNNNNNANQTFNTHFNPLGGFYNGNANVNRNMTATIPTSASLLVEAALNSVSSMIGSTHDMGDNGNNQQMSIDEGHQPEDLPDEMNSPEFQQSTQQQQQQTFPIHLPSMSTFTNSVNASMMQDNGEIDVDAASTPKSQEKMCAYTPSSNNGDKEVQGSFQNQQNDSCSPARTMTPMTPDQHNVNFNTNSYNSQRNVQQIQTSPRSQLSQRPLYGSEHDLASPASTPSLPRYDFGAETYRARREKNLAASNLVHQHHQQQQQQQTPQMTPQISSDEENSIVIAENLSVSHQQAQQQSHVVNEKLKLNAQISDLMYASNKYGDNSAINQLHRESLNDLRLKYNEQGLEIQEFATGRNSVVNENSANAGDYHQGLDMSSRAGIAAGYHSHNFAAAAAATSSFNRYQHHIYDILTERDQQNAAAQQAQQEHHPFQLQQQQQQQIQHLLQDHISATHQDHDSDPSGVDLSRTSNYIVPPPSTPTPHLPTHSYSHTHSEMLRMASLDLSSASGSAASGMVVGSNNSHHVRHHTSFLPPHAATNRELSDHHRFLSTADQRLLVDPTAHLLIENNRLLSASAENNRILDQTRLLSAAESPAANRHVVSPRGFGAYHHAHHSHPHQVKYHQSTHGAPSNQQQNYHPFSASYY